MTESSEFAALILGLLEGLTEFIPVSSTAHLLLAAHFLDFTSPGHTFEVMIQLGAILALLVVYAGKLFRIAIAIPTDEKARRFVVSILVAFLPSALMGALAYNLIKTVLFESPELICSVLIIGGVALAIVDRMKHEPKYFDILDYTPSLAFKIGLFQCLALIPGTSRAGATIAGALLLGTDKRSAAEFSFFLAVPTMIGAFALDLAKNWDALSFAALTDIGIGFGAAFVTGLLVVRSLLNFVARHGFGVFAWWRIIVGSAGFAGLYLMG
ncbi:undecaprenyl-diphosphate phosphatase [Rhizobium sp. L1K21]|uniref:undecaprenyl-diphosphate phosphatase n=1 Tax=Rhizobium sp. L1K21 TaxID=2954933 RepID=UPI002092E4A2|nr:undecaprenyl-diphosphate phosphatase [Rhizobium sp. L1K21]MCO6187334.1 undecaprenyl-diphosphate phosphatase [Rhizobium sp. L1K21]